ncbi:MAG: Hint domain-containing protein [Paracoccaceae bacterium]|nr:Hint domain-containing protein [Paracoccaceae bacterium]
MGWIALSDPMGRTHTARLPGVSLLERGSLLVEVVLDPDISGAVTLLQYRENKDWSRTLCLTLDPTEGLRLVQRQGAREICVTLACAIGPEVNALRILYAWNAPDRCCRLSLECVETGTLVHANGRDPLPMPMSDVTALFAPGPHLHKDASVLWYGVTTGVVPLGLDASLSASTILQGPSGPVRADRIEPGDLVMTVDHGAQPVRWCRRFNLPAMGSFAPVRLRAPYYATPRDLIVSQRARIVLSGAEVEYLFGEDEVLVQARHLVNNRTALFETRRTVVDHVSLMFDRHELLDVGGCRVESLYRGRGAVAVHTQSARRELHDYEMITLMGMREAARNPVAA